MEKYWALDYVDDEECEMIVNDQLYATEEEAARARDELEDPTHYEVNWYSIYDLEFEYGRKVHITTDLKVE